MFPKIVTRVVLVAAALMGLWSLPASAQSRNRVTLTTPGQLRNSYRSIGAARFRRHSYGLGSSTGPTPRGTGTALQSRLRSSMSSSRTIRRRGRGGSQVGGGLDSGGGLLGLQSAGVRLDTGSLNSPTLDGPGLTRSGERSTGGSFRPQLSGETPSGTFAPNPTLRGVAAYIDAVESMGASLAGRSETITSLVPDNPGPLREYISAGEAALKSGDRRSFARAADQFELASVLAPRAPEVLLNLVHANFGETVGSYAMAAYYLRDALRYAPRLPAAPLRPAQFFKDHPLVTERLDVLEHHIEDHPDDADARLVLAYFRWFADDREVDQIRRYLSEALAIAREDDDDATVTAVQTFWRGIAAAEAIDEPLKPATPSAEAPATRPAEDAP